MEECQIHARPLPCRCIYSNVTPPIDQERCRPVAGARRRSDVTGVGRIKPTGDAVVIECLDEKVDDISFGSNHLKSISEDVGFHQRMILFLLIS